MKNTIATSVFLKANSTAEKKIYKRKVEVFTDMDLYEEEDIIQEANNRKVLDYTWALNKIKQRKTFA